jgi:hypothetical protein
MQRKPAQAPDPGKTKSSGLKEAWKEPKLPEKGRPATGKDAKPKGDGLKAAWGDRGKTPSKLSPMAGAKKATR